MSYSQLKDGTILINGFEKGIADDPYKGISDMRNINIISVPGEGSVNFKTEVANPQNSTATIVSANTTDETITITGGNFDQGQAVVFSGGSLPTGITAGTTYWLTLQSSGVYFVWTDYGLTTLVNITTTGTGTVASINVGYMKYFTKLSNSYTQSYWGVDNNGRVWTDMRNPATAGTVWTYTGNSITTRGGDSYAGFGIASYSPTNNLSSTFGYIFVYSAGAIDYAKITSNNTIVWNYGWNPASGTTGNSNYLKTGQSNSVNGTHETLLAPDNVIYYCDSRYIGRFYEAPNQNFDPTSTTTYIFDETPLLPTNDVAICLAFLGTNVMVGGQKNYIYPWNTTSPTFDIPLAIAESYISKMVTINTNTFILAGNRGRVYYTNGSQAQLFKKIPDHISGTVEPYFQWGGIATTKNQLYLSASCTTNDGTAINNYGGVWAIDIDTKSIRLTNKLTYGTYAGYASALIPIINTVVGSNPGGAGLYIGWNSGVSTYGIDRTISTPYSSGECTIDSDLIPVGTVLIPKTNGTLEFKLAYPVTSNDSIKLQYRQKFSDSFADCSTTVFSYATSTIGGGSGWNGYSGIYQNVNFQNSQWLQVRAVLTSSGTTSTSYLRLTEIRIK